MLEYFKKLTFRRAFHDLGSLGLVIGGGGAIDGLIQSQMNPKTVSIYLAVGMVLKGLGSLVGEKTTNNK